MIDICVRFSNQIAFVNRLKSLGLVVRDEINEEGMKRSAEQWIESCTTPILESVTGDKYLTFRCDPGQADKLPPSNNPAFAILWRSDVYVDDGEGNMAQEPWPEVEVQAYDIDGNPEGTQMQGVGRIA